MTDASLTARINRLDWAALEDALEHTGLAAAPGVLAPEACAEIAALYDEPHRFRSKVLMARHGFGRGEYQYFSDPLPPVVAELRRALYPPLARIANLWAERLGACADWPSDWEALADRCRAAGQTKPTPLLLRYGPGDHNRLHQDLYGPLHFPFQVVIGLDRPGADYEGGALCLTETQPRRQSRVESLILEQGMAAFLPVRERPIRGARGWNRVQMRHGVSTIRAGLRRTLGIIFHDAA